MTIQHTSEDCAHEFLSDKLFQYFSKEHFEQNTGLSVSDEKWSWFVETCGSVFGEACIELASDIWNTNESEYEGEE